MFARSLFLSALSLVFAASAHAGIEGIYQTNPNDEGSYIHVKLANCADNDKLICGTIHAAFNSEGEQNEEYENIGKKMIWKMNHVGKGIYKDGFIWAPDTDKTYNSEMKLDGDTLTVEGCILFICRGQDWTRVQ